MTSRAIQVELPNGDVIWARVPVDGISNIKSGTLQRLDVDDLPSGPCGASRKACATR